MTDPPTPTFPGFPAAARVTAIPSLFFADLLPEIDDPAELLVSFYVFYALGRKPAATRWLTADELLADAGLGRALKRLGGPVDQLLRRGLAAAAGRGTLIRAETPGGVRWTVNAPAHRRALLGPDEATPGPLGPAATEPVPSIYSLYQENIGTIGPLIAEELRAAEEEYPPAWIVEAFREAARGNKRSWRYIARILERWRDEGRHDATVGRDPGARGDLAGRYRGLIRH